MKTKIFFIIFLVILLLGVVDALAFMPGCTKCMSNNCTCGPRASSYVPTKESSTCLVMVLLWTMVVFWLTVLVVKFTNWLVTSGSTESHKIVESGIIIDGSPKASPFKETYEEKDSKLLVSSKLYKWDISNKTEVKQIYEKLHPNEGKYKICLNCETANPKDLSYCEVCNRKI